MLEYKIPLSGCLQCHCILLEEKNPDAHVLLIMMSWFLIYCTNQDNILKLIKSIFWGAFNIVLCFVEVLIWYPSDKLLYNGQYYAAVQTMSNMNLIELCFVLVVMDLVETKLKSIHKTWYILIYINYRCFPIVLSGLQYFKWWVLNWRRWSKLESSTGPIERTRARPEPTDL